MFFQKNKSIVGIDVGTGFIKIAQITHGPQKTLDTYGIVNASLSFDMKSNQTSIVSAAEILKRLLSEAGVSAKQCIVSLPNNAVFTSIIDMPQLSDEELESAISFEAKKYVPLPLTEVILSWTVVAKLPEGGKQRVLLIAVPKQVQENYIQLFSLTGLDLSIIEIEALALIRSLSGDTKENSVIIDIGARNTGLNVVVDGVLQLTRNLNIGGDTITDTIAKTLNISKQRAEQFKKDFGLTEAEFIPEAVKPVMDSIKNEVKQLVSVYASRSAPIKKLLIVGGGAHLPGIVEYFKDVGVPVSFGKPLAGLVYSPEAGPIVERYELQLPVAVGLALRHI
jgi:type IV pilus assembly protein PilM